MDDVEYELGDDVFNEETESGQSDGSPDDATPSNDYSPIDDDLVAEEKRKSHSQWEKTRKAWWDITMLKGEQVTIDSSKDGKVT